MKWFSQSPHEGDTRELSAPQSLPADQWLESEATHEYYDGQAWCPAVVETLGENARYVVPALRTWPDDGE